MKRKHDFWCKTCNLILSPLDFWYAKSGSRHSRCKKCDYKLKQDRRVKKRNGIDNRFREDALFCNGCQKTKTAEDFFFSGPKQERYYLCRTCVASDYRDYYYNPANKSKVLARIAVRHAVSRGDIEPAKNLACVDCGKQAKEYDHYLGYDNCHWLSVQPVCYSCHKYRTVKYKW